MDLRKGLAAVAAALLALAVWMWSAARPSSAPLDAPAPERSAPAASAELADPDAPVAAREGLAQPETATTPVRAVERGLRVRSTSGLGLPAFEWRAPDAAWQRVELDGDGRARELPPAPCEVRALGHVVAVLEPDVEELALEPDVLVRLLASDLRGCAREIDVHDPFLLDSQRGTELDRRRPNLGLWGFVADDEWVAAVSAESVLREFGDRELRIVLYRRDGRRTDVVLDTASGLRVDWPVPCDDIVPTAPLRVTVVRPDGLAEGAIEVHVGRTGTWYEDTQRETYPWGFVLHAPIGAWGPKLVLAEGEDELEFEGVPLGIAHGVVAQNTTSKAYGFVQFVHDGTPRSLDLRPPLRVRGRLLDARDDTAIPRASVVWQCMSDGEKVTGWRAEAFDAVLADDGSFDLAGPMTPPAPPSRPMEPPGILAVHIESPGFQTLELEREIGAARVIDLGDLRLDARAPDLVLAPGHGLTPEQVDWMGFEIAGQPGRSWGLRWGNLAPDGALELHYREKDLERMALPASDPKAKATPDWSTAEALMLYVLDDDAPVRAFERDAQGRYAAVEMRRYACTFEVEPTASELNWWFGWEWKGLFGVCVSATRPAAGEPLRIELVAPARGARLGWVSREGGRSGVLRPDELAPFSDAMPVFVLR